MRLKRTPGDKWFSDCVRIAVNWTCENCQRPFGGRAQGLHCSHWIGRGISYATRFDPMNAFAHCYKCHSILGADTPAFYDYARQELGDIGIEILTRRKYDTALGKLFKQADKGGEKSELARHFKAEFKHMEGIRNDGYTRKLEFEAWSPE